MDIDLPDVLAEVTAAFERYEAALVSNDVAMLDELFHADKRSLRYGVGENLYGHDEIMAFRAARSPVGLGRRTARTLITTYGR
ncbi:MAG TPA: AtzH-like domain-containing protein, partial [Bradyrhizobium sp.]|nr:AtzH-like domain-containing protein [Bradyrhizobium sp.]